MENQPKKRPLDWTAIGLTASMAFIVLCSAGFLTIPMYWTLYHHSNPHLEAVGPIDRIIISVLATFPTILGIVFLIDMIKSANKFKKDWGHSYYRQ